MKVSDALPFVSHVLDTALSPDHNVSEIGKGTYLIGWQCGFEPLFVAVIASYTEAMDASDAEEIAADYLDEMGWFANGVTDADHILYVNSDDVG